MPRPEGQFTEALKDILKSGIHGTQEAICEELKTLGYKVTQSTVSRGLRKLGAVRATDAEGNTVYRLGEESAPLIGASLKDLIIDILSNGSTIVIRTTPGSASLVARHLDHTRPAGILGTIAGDDTIFIAPFSMQKINKTIQAIEESLQSVKS